MTNPIRMLLLLFFISLMPFVIEARAEENPSTDHVLGEIEDIKTRLTNVEKQQQEIADKDNEILAKLDQLRVWVHRK